MSTITFTTRLTAVLLCVGTAGVAATMARGQEALASPTNASVVVLLQQVLREVDVLKRQLAEVQAKVEATTPRTFYLTTTSVDGAGAPFACDTGFHMASIWEVHDPTQLHYDTQRGLTTADAGSGPPSDEFGWIRTGNVSRDGDAGEANCQAYSSGQSTDRGTLAQLTEEWDSPAVRASPWSGFRMTCERTFPVWCVRD